MTRLELRPRVASEIVDAAFQLYRRHFAELVSLSALFFAPYILAELVVTGGRGVGAETAGASMSALLLLGWLVGSLLEAAVVVSVSSSYLSGAPDVSGAVRRTLSRFSSVLAAVTAKWVLIALAFMLALMVALLLSLVVTLVVSGGTVSPADMGSGEAGLVLGAGLSLIVAVLISVPVGLWFFARYFAVPATVILEGLGVRAGLRRSRELARGLKRRIIGALGLPMLLFIVMQFALVSTFELLPLPRLIGFVVEQAASVIAYPILAVIATLLYYDARIRKEGFDIEVMAAELAGAESVRAEPT